MKTQKLNRNRAQASVLIVTLIITAILGTTLAAYLLMVQNQNLSVVRSQTWNSSMAVTEAGIEDGLQLLNKYAGNFIGLTNWTLTYAADGWTATSTPNVYYIRRYIGPNYYDLYVTNLFVDGATICSLGHVAENNPYAYAPQTMFAGIGLTAPQTLPTINRQVYVRTKVDPLFNVAMAALQTIDISGHNVTSDSFNSADTNYSTLGLYDPAKREAHGDIVTDDTIVNALNMGNATIYGSIKTGPNGSIQCGPNGLVGDLNWTGPGIETNHSANDMNVLFPDVVEPAGSLLWTYPPLYTGAPINGQTYQYVFPTSGNYTIASITGGVFIGTNANVQIRVTSAISISGGAGIVISPGGSLKIYMVGASASFGGQGVGNQTGNAASFYYFGLPSNTSLSFSGNASFIGAIYAPEADFNLKGSGNSTTTDFVGSSVTKSVKMTGNYNFHYDENLRRNGMGHAYVPVWWQEASISN